MSNKDPDSGIGSKPVNRPPEQKPSSSTDEKSYVWRPYKPGFEINQHGHLRTTTHRPG